MKKVLICSIMGLFCGMFRPLFACPILQDISPQFVEKYQDNIINDYFFAEEMNGHTCVRFIDLMFPKDGNDIYVSVLIDENADIFGYYHFAICRGDYIFAWPRLDIIVANVQNAQSGGLLFYFYEETLEEILQEFTAGGILSDIGVQEYRQHLTMQQFDSVEDAMNGLCVISTPDIIPDGLFCSYFATGTQNTCVPCSLVVPQFAHSDGTRTDISDCYGYSSPGYYIDFDINTGEILEEQCRPGYYCPGGIKVGADMETGTVSGGNLACSALPGVHDILPDNATSASGAINPTDCYIDVDGGEFGTFIDESGTYIYDAGMCPYIY